jgi:hypothetical protein
MFAARYHMYAMRRRKLQDEEDLLQRQTWYHFPVRAHELFDKKGYEPEPVTVGGRDIEEVVDELDMMDAYFANLDEKREVSGGGDRVTGMFGRGPKVGEWV